MRKTKIIATLGPKTEEIGQIRKLARAGMDVARLNFSHGTHAQFKNMIAAVRTVESELGKPIGIIADLQGPKIRIGQLKRDRKVKTGEIIILTTKKPSKNEIPIQYKNLPKDVKIGDKLLIDDGCIETRIEKITVRKTKIYVKILNDGVIKSNKGINAPDSVIRANSLTPKDKKDLAFALKNGANFIALSFVRDAKDIRQLKKLIKKNKGKARVIAKIERSEALEHLEKIVRETDAVMIARGDLGMEIRAEKLPIIQKHIIKLANVYEKPVITATQILTSMCENPNPTRAEISDAANAVLDNTDCLMLSNETSVGKYPVRAVQILDRVAHFTESEMRKDPTLSNLKRS